jgi:hydroxypyruvate reductase
MEDIPPAVKDHLQAGMDGLIPETPKVGDRVFRRVHNFIIGSNILALEATKQKALEMGFHHSLILSSMIEGETREIARVHTAMAKEILKTKYPVEPPACLISGGETTVTVRGDGKGGRNQEFALAAALDLMEVKGRVVIRCGGTDGNDGPTPAAGAIVDPFTVKGGQDIGLDARSYLNNNDSYHFFEKTGELLVTGPTNTNVMDVRIILVR